MWDDEEYYYEDPSGYTGGTDSSELYISPYYYEDPYGYTGGTESTGTTYVSPYYYEDPYGHTGGTESTGTTYVSPYYYEDPSGYTGGTESITLPRMPLVRSPSGISKIWEVIKNVGGKALDYVGENPGQVGLAAILAALGALNKAPPTGGGVEERYVGPKKALARTVVDNPNIPGAKLVRYAAQGGIMHAYANGGKVAPAYADGKPLVMQDGGFVFTGRAAEAANRKYGGIKNLIPEAKMISAPGNATDDRGATVIVGNRGNVTPARVSNDEAYVPPGYDTGELQALMKSLERRA
jgi:hypothetical protein